MVNSFILTIIRKKNKKTLNCTPSTSVCTYVITRHQSSSNYCNNHHMLTGDNESMPAYLTSRVCWVTDGKLWHHFHLRGIPACTGRLSTMKGSGCVFVYLFIYFITSWLTLRSDLNKKNNLRRVSRSHAAVSLHHNNKCPDHKLIKDRRVRLVLTLMFVCII